MKVDANYMIKRMEYEYVKPEFEPGEWAQLEALIRSFPAPTPPPAEGVKDGIIFVSIEYEIAVGNEPFHSPDGYPEFVCSPRVRRDAETLRYCGETPTKVEVWDNA